jgi:uncharacterized protein
MAKSISEITHSLRELGDTPISDLHIAELLNKEIHIGTSLRRLGNLKVMDWDFKDAMPGVHRFANQEVHFPEVIVRAAQFKVLDWNFRTGSPSEENPQSDTSKKFTRRHLSPVEMQDLMDRLRGFLQYIVVNLISRPDLAEIRIQEIETGVLRFRLLVIQKDVKDMIGRDGATASSIRNLLKTTAASEGIHALLEILSHEEELAQSKRD